MGFLKSPEEKAAEEAAKQQAAQAEAVRQQAAQVERRRKAFLASPAGLATTAKEAGDLFFEVQLEVGRQERDAVFGAQRDVGGHRTSAASTLAAIEGLGWRLEHVGYVFLVTGETSTDKMFISGEQTAVSGKTVGIYLFRNPDATPPVPPVAP